MRILLATFCFLLSGGVLCAQALMGFDHPMLDNTTVFFGSSYDTAFSKKTKWKAAFKKSNFFIRFHWATCKKHLHCA